MVRSPFLTPKLADLDTKLILLPLPIHQRLLRKRQVGSGLQIHYLIFIDVGGKMRRIG